MDANNKPKPLFTNLCFFFLLLNTNLVTVFVCTTFYSSRSTPSPPTTTATVSTSAATSASENEDFDLPPEFKAFTSPNQLPFGVNRNFNSDKMFGPVGRPCTEFPDELREYMTYNINGSCPDDELLGQKLLLKGCEPLPRRRCRSAAPAESVEPYPLPDSLWTTPDDSTVVWTLYISISQRLPFFDNTLDMVHSMHVLSNWIPTTLLHFLFFDIYRVLRPGGLFWLDHFFCVGDQFEDVYQPLINSVGFNRIKWVVGPKLDRGPELREMYLSALLEKPLKNSW